MNARDYLQQGFYLDKKIESNLREVAELRNLCMGISAAGLEESHNPNQPTEAPFVRTIEKIWEREQEINKEIDRLVDLKYEIGKVIDQVEDEAQRLVLRDRYIHFDSWEDIARSMGKGIRWIYTVHGEGMAAVEEILRQAEEKCSELHENAVDIH